MDIIKFNNNSSTPTKMENAEVIDGFNSKMWVERYAEAGEFTLVAPISSDIRYILPIGTFISHTETTEIMVVENHGIKDNADGATEVTITGRGFETLFENRIVGSNRTFPVVEDISGYSLASDHLCNQIVYMLKDHIYESQLSDDDYAIPYVSVMSVITNLQGSTARNIKFDSLYKTMVDLLNIKNYGIKVIRPGPWSPLASGSPNIAIVVHEGVDRTSDIMFSYQSNDITSGEYLWSRRKLKNAAFISGKWVATTYTTAPTKANRRVMYIDASDLDQGFTTAPTGAWLSAIISTMQQRGQDAIAAQTDIALTKADIARQGASAVYRRDFDVGDIIYISGDYDEGANMRVTEYVESEDNTGESGYPTLSLI